MSEKVDQLKKLSWKTKGKILQKMSQFDKNLVNERVEGQRVDKIEEQLGKLSLKKRSRVYKQLEDHGFSSEAWCGAADDPSSPVADGDLD